MPSVQNTSASELVCHQFQVSTLNRLLSGQLKCPEDIFNLDVPAVGCNRLFHEPSLLFQVKNIAEHPEASLDQFLIVNHSQHRYQVLFLFSH